jgi:hypothetical protein
MWHVASVSATAWRMIAGHGVLLSFGQKVGNLQAEHFGQLGKVLTTGVSAARLPGLDLLVLDPERPTQGDQGKTSVYAGLADALAGGHGAAFLASQRAQ